MTSKRCFSHSRLGKASGEVHMPLVIYEMRARNLVPYTCGIKAVRYGTTFDLHVSEKSGVLHHLQITQHERSARASVHLRLAIVVSQPLLSGLQSAVTKTLCKNLLVNIN
jgi:hypothetical protein